MTVTVETKQQHKTEQHKTEQHKTEARKAQARKAPIMDSTAATATAQPGTATLREISFVEPMAGFEDDTVFTVNPIDDGGMLVSLRSTRDETLRFVVTPAEVFFADYRDSLMPLLTTPVTGALGGRQGKTQLQMFVLLTISDSLADTTANMRAPIVVDVATGKAVQVILDDKTLPMDHPLLAA